MLMAGIVSLDSRCETANLVNSIFSSTGKKVSITDSKNLLSLDSKRVRSYITELERNNTEILILKIHFSDLIKEVFDNIRFDIMICTNISDDLKEDNNFNSYDTIMNRVTALLDDKGIAIVNVNDIELIKILQDMKHCIVTYGFNSKANITTSSVGDMMSENSFMCCLQNTISAKNGVSIEPQEYRINIGPNEVDSYDVLAAATFAIINGIDLNSVNPTLAKM